MLAFIAKPEVILIIVIAVLLLFGSGKIVEAARSFGRVTGEFKKSKAEMDRELKASEASEASETEH